MQNDSRKFGGYKSHSKKISVL